MKVYKLTKVGKKVVKNMSGDSEEMRILNYLRDYGTATDDQLEVVGETWLVKRLERDKIIEQLTEVKA